MKKLLRLVVALSVLLSATAFAGAINQLPVVIDLDNLSAEGDQWTARNSKNSVEQIGCGVDTFSDPGGAFTFTFGFCQATDADGVYIVCTTFDPSLLETMRATTAFAFIEFDWEENGTCTHVKYSTQSWYLPRFTVRGDPEDD